MKLHQLKIDYRPEQDRLWVLLSTTDGVEVRLALTRRYVKLLWPLLVKLAEESNPRISTQANPEAKRAVFGMEHEQAVSRADFTRPYEEAPARERPLGTEPILLVRIQTGRDPTGQAVLAVHPAEGQGITLTLDAVLLHSLCRLLQAAVKASDWDMELNLPGGVPAADPDLDAPRTLN